MLLTEKLRDEVVEVLGIEKRDIETRIGENSDTLELTDGSEYIILNDDEADEQAQNRIEDMLWAFNPSFLSGYTDLNESVFEALAELYENANEAILALINVNGSLSDFADEAINVDGRGHFLSSYDGEEYKLPENDLYMYREN